MPISRIHPRNQQASAAPSSGGLTKSELGGIIGGAIALLMVVVITAFIIITRLNRTSAKASTSDYVIRNEKKKLTQVGVTQIRVAATAGPSVNTDERPHISLNEPRNIDLGTVQKAISNLSLSTTRSDEEKWPPTSQQFSVPKGFHSMASSVLSEPCDNGEDGDDASECSDDSTSGTASFWMSDYSEGVPMLEAGHPLLEVKPVVLQKALNAFDKGSTGWHSQHGGQR